MYNPLTDPIIQRYTCEFGKLATMTLIGMNLVSAVESIELQLRGVSAEQVEKSYKHHFLREPYAPTDKQEPNFKKFLRTKIDWLAFYGSKPGRYMGYKIFQTYDRTKRRKL